LRGLCLHKKWITDAQAQTGAWFRQCFEDRKAVLNTCVQKSIATVRGFLIPDVINMVRRHNAPALNKINAGQAGSEDPTSDIDLNQNGVNTEDMTKVCLFCFSFFHLVYLVSLGVQRRVPENIGAGVGLTR